MTRDVKILSMLAGGVLLAAIAMLAVVSQRTHSVGETSGDIASVAPGSTVAAGRMAADFKLPDLRGASISLSSLRGKVVFLNIWATWCAPCREEMPAIESLYEEFRNEPDFVVLAVSQDTSSAATVESYVAKNRLKFKVLLDPDNRVGDAYRVTGIPESFVIGRDGRIIAHHVGPYDWSSTEMRDVLRELLNSKEGSSSKASSKEG